MSEGVREIEMEADGIVQQWHYRHYEDYIPSKKTIEGAMYGELSLRIAFALTQAEKRGFDRAREKDAEIARLKMLVDFPESSFKWRWAKAQEEIAELRETLNDYETVVADMYESKIASLSQKLEKYEKKIKELENELQVSKSATLTMRELHDLYTDYPKLKKNLVAVKKIIQEIKDNTIVQGTHEEQYLYDLAEQALAEIENNDSPKKSEEV